MLECRSPRSHMAMRACKMALILPMHCLHPPFRRRGLALHVQGACCGHGPVSARSAAILERRTWRRADGEADGEADVSKEGRKEVSRRSRCRRRGGRRIEPSQGMPLGSPSTKGFVSFSMLLLLHRSVYLISLINNVY